MGKLALKNVFFKVNSVDLSTYVADVDVGEAVDQVDVTGMGSTSRERIPGLRDDTVDVTLWQDFGTGAVDQTLSGLVGSGSVFPIEIGPNGSSYSATNPKYSGSVQLFEYHPIAGGVGDGAQTKVTFLPTAAGITRSTA